MKPFLPKISTQKAFPTQVLDQVDPISTIFYGCLTFTLKIAIYRLQLVSYVNCLTKKEGKIATKAFFPIQTNQKPQNLSKKRLFYRNNR